MARCGFIMRIAVRSMYFYVFSAPHSKFELDEHFPLNVTLIILGGNMTVLYKSNKLDNTIAMAKVHAFVIPNNEDLISVRYYTVDETIYSTCVTVVPFTFSVFCSAYS